MSDRIPVRVLDSAAVTMAQGMIAIDLAERAQAGASLDELYARGMELIGKTGVAGTIDTLEHLIKGGRLKGAKAIYRAAPNMMVVVPDSTTVELSYGPSGLDRASYLLTFAGIALVVLWSRRRFRYGTSLPPRHSDADGVEGPDDAEVPGDVADTELASDSDVN